MDSRITCLIFVDKKNIISVSHAEEDIRLANVKSTLPTIATPCSDESSFSFKFKTTLSQFNFPHLKTSDKLSAAIQ